MEIRDGGLSSVGAQDMDTNGYQVSDLDDIQFVWESDQLDTDAVFRPGNDTPFSPSATDDLEMRASVQLDEEEGKEKSHPSTPVFLRLSQSPVPLRIRPFGTRVENLPVFFNGNLFH